MRLQADAGARIILEDGCGIGEGARLVAHAGELRLGRDVRLGDRCIVVARAGVTIGNRCRLGDWVTITDFEPVTDSSELPVRLQGVRARAVRIGEGAVLDHAANVLAGVTIGPGARVGAHAIVAADVPAGGSVEEASAAMAPAAAGRRPSRPPVGPATR